MTDAFVHRLAQAYFEQIRGLLHSVDMAALTDVAAVLQRARLAGRTIYLAGNGGSAATASHWANDLGKATRRPDAPPVRVVSLGDQLAWVTALANDEGYERVFAGQLESLAQPGDVLVVFSASGNSPNLVAAVQVAAARGTTTVGMLGFDGGVLKALVDHVLWIPSPRGAYGPVEDVHMVAGHVLCSCLAQDVTMLAVGGVPGVAAGVHASD